MIFFFQTLEINRHSTNTGVMLCPALALYSQRWDFSPGMASGKLSFASIVPRRLLPLFALIPLLGTSVNRSSAAGAMAPLVDREVVSPSAIRPRLSFEKNEGQSEEAVEFVARGQGYSLLLGRQESVFVLRRPGIAQMVPLSKINPSIGTVSKDLVVRFRLTGAVSDSVVLATAERTGFVNYYRGSDAKKHLTNVPTFGRVEYIGVYPGVDMVYYSSEDGRLQYDFRIAPDGDYRDIGLRFAGELQREGGIQTDDRGNLVLTVQDGAQLEWKKPFAYQIINGVQQEVAARFEVCSDRSVGFSLGSFDRSKPLVIDPVLTYTTYLGGARSDEATGIAVDGVGNAWVVGYTGSTNFPVAGPPYQGSNGNPDNNSPDVFISKFSPSGTLLYSTYFGGSADDLGAGIAIDGLGNAWIAGRALSINLPVTGSAAQATNAGGVDAFVAKFGPTGNLLYSSYLGGSEDEEATAIAIDGSNNIWITGTTNSTNFRTAGNPALGSNSGGKDAFVAKFDSSGQLLYSTYLGGAADDFGYGIAVDPSSSAWVTGSTTSTNFPLAGTPVQASTGGLSDAFVARFTATGSLVYSTYFGGVNDDNGFAIAADPQDNVWIAGDSGSPNFPTTSGAYQATYTAFQEAILAKFSSSGALLYSTFLGASGFEAAYGIAVAPTGDVWLAGFTDSSEDYPLTPDPFQSSYGGIQDAFVTKFTSGGALAYSTYLGGSSVEAANAIAVGPNNQVWFAGYSVSSDLPMVGAPFQNTGGGNSLDAFVGRLDNNASPVAEQRLVNISTRLRVETGDNALIGGFIVQGAKRKRVMVRAIGPSLTASGVPALETLQDPTLELHNSTGAILISNDNWKDGPQKQAIIDSTIPPSDDRESAVVAALDPGAYTAVVRGSGDTTGVALVELYDLDAASPSRMVNISTRGRVETGGNVMIGGLIIGGTIPTRVIVRALGPSLSASVSDALLDPTLELRDGNGSLVDSNDNWMDSPQRQAIIDTTLPPTDNRESAVLDTLNPGSYTAIVRGVNATQGVALVEVYKLN